ncbi:MAG: hypothetical protein E7Z85_09615 [Methanosphaera stadtmanae]|nr:hypothetical protein [Methanosphaera stadtmanae]
MCEDYYLNVLQENNTFKFIRKLTTDEKERFFKAKKFMHKLNVKLLFFRIVDHDYNELKKFEIKYNEQINSHSLSTLDENAVIFEFTRLLHNYLSTVNLFLNQYQANVKRDYEDELFIEYDELRKDFYTENLSYRIIYELQNEERHSRIPSVKIKAKRKYFMDPLEAKFYIKKEYLNINRLKKDEEFMDLEEIDIYEHMENMNSYLFELASRILKFELDLHGEYYDFLKGLIGEIDVEGRPCVMNYTEFDENTIKPTISFIDKRFIELIDKIKKYKDII